ncbi:MAG: GntR family transcriptional regulator [Acidimicrobiales bacterium]
MVARTLGGTGAKDRDPAVRPRIGITTAGDRRGGGPATPQPADAVYVQLRQELIAGDLLPQQRLVEAELCSRLHTGRGTVRAVLLRLEHEGLVVREPYRGAHVRVVDEREAVEITEARAVLEALAARRAAVMADEGDLAEIRAIHSEMRPALKKGDLLAYSDANRRLHARIVEASRHATTQHLLSGLKAQMVRYQYRTILVPGRPQQSLAEHSALVGAIVRRDPDRAAAAMIAHLNGVVTTLYTAAGRGADSARGLG